MAPVLVGEVRFRTQSGPGSWDGELDRVMGVTGVSVSLLITPCAALQLPQDLFFLFCLIPVLP